MATTYEQQSIESQIDAPSGWFERLQWNMSRALIITRREVTDMMRDWRIIAPIVFLTAIFPTIANWGAGRMIGFVEQYGANIVGDRLVPFLLMVVGFFPISFSLIIALETFVGEKERRSLEPLLTSPLTNLQLYIGKMLSATVPPLIGSFLGISVYLIGVYFNIDYLPPLTLFIQIILLTIMHAVMMVAGAVVVSSQTTSVRAANLLASFIILPVAFLIQLEAFIMFWATYSVLWWILLGLLMITVVLIRMGVRSFNREELIGAEIDELDLGKGIKRVGSMIVAREGGRGPWQWYRDEVLGVLPKLVMPLLIVIGAMVVGYLVGVDYMQQFPLPEEVLEVEEVAERFPALIGEMGLQSGRGILLIVFQNLRVLAVGTALAVFTLGIGIVVLLMAPFGILGYIIPQLLLVGLEPAFVMATLLPHGIIEGAAAAIAGAAAVRLGASVVSPPPGKTIGEGWMMALADTVRVWVGLVLPLLIIGAVVESMITPRLAIAILGG